MRENAQYTLSKLARTNDETTTKQTPQKPTANSETTKRLSKHEPTHKTKESHRKMEIDDLHPIDSSIPKVLARTSSNNLSPEKEYALLSRFLQNVMSFQVFKKLKEQGFTSRQLEILFGEDIQEKNKHSKAIAKGGSHREPLSLLLLEGPTCAICDDSRSFQDDPILQCAVCGLCVHQNCAGVSDAEVQWILRGQWESHSTDCGTTFTHLRELENSVQNSAHHSFDQVVENSSRVGRLRPTRLWYCDPCKYGIESQTIRCCVCPTRNGCFKSVDISEEKDIDKLMKKAKQKLAPLPVDLRRYLCEVDDRTYPCLDKSNMSGSSHESSSDDGTYRAVSSVVGSLVDLVACTVSNNVQDTLPSAVLEEMNKTQFKAWAAANAPWRCYRPPKYWMHVQCAAYLPEPSFSDSLRLSPVVDVRRIDVRRFDLKCLICRQKQGACVQCNFGTCGKAFHVTCAQNNGFCFRFEWVDSNNHPEFLGRFMLYCSKDDPRDTKDRRRKIESLERENYLRKRRYESAGVRQHKPEGTHIQQQKLINKRREELSAMLHRFNKEHESGSPRSGSNALVDETDSDDSDVGSTGSSSTDSLHSAIGGFDECGDSSSDEEWDGSVASLVRYMVDKRNEAFDADRHRDKSRFSRSRRRKMDAGASSAGNALPEDIDESPGTLSLVLRPRVAADVWPAVSPYFIPVTSEVAKKSVNSVLPHRKLSNYRLPNVPLEERIKTYYDTRIMFQQNKGVKLRVDENNGRNTERLLRIFDITAGTPLHALYPPFYHRYQQFLEQVLKSSNTGDAKLMSGEPKPKIGSHPIVEGTVYSPEHSLLYRETEFISSSDSLNETDRAYTKASRVGNKCVDPEIAKLVEEVVASVELECEGSVSNRNYIDNQQNKQGVLTPLSSLLFYEAKSRKQFYQKLATGEILTHGEETELPGSLKKRLRLIDDDVQERSKRTRRLELSGGGSPMGDIIFRSAASDVSSGAIVLKEQALRELGNYTVCQFKVKRPYKAPKIREENMSSEMLEEHRRHAHDDNDPAFFPPRPLGKHFTQLWKEEDEACGRNIEYDGHNVTLSSVDRGASRRAASRLSMGVSLPNTSLGFDARDSDMSPCESSTAFACDNGEKSSSAGSTRNHFAGWGRGDDFSHLRQSYVASLEAYPPLTQLINAARKKGICQNTNFRFAEPKTRRLRLKSGEEIKLRDSMLLHAINRVNKSFSCTADFQASLETKNEFTLVAEKGGHMVGFINYYFMWFSQSKIGAGKRPPPERVMYVATLQAVKQETHEDLTKYPSPSGRHASQVDEQSEETNPGSEPRTGTLLFALACQHALCVGISSALCDSTPEALEYYLKIFNMQPTTMTVENAKKKALENVNDSPGSSVGEDRDRTLNEARFSVRMEQYLPPDGSPSMDAEVVPEADTDLDETSPRASPKGNNDFVKRSGNSPSRAAVLRSHGNNSRYIPLHLPLESESIVSTVNVSPNELEQDENDDLKENDPKRLDNEHHQEDEIADEVIALQKDLRKLMQKNDNKAWWFVYNVHQSITEEESQWKVRSFYRRAWRAWKREARRRAVERQRAMQQAEEDLDAVCSVCHGGDSHPANQIVFCESCNLAVHQRCYGVIAIPEGDWFCDVCAAAGGAQAALQQHTPLHIPCVACGIRRGAMKATDSVEGRRHWIHVVCARICGLTMGAVAQSRFISRTKRIRSPDEACNDDPCPIVVPASPKMEPIRGVKPNSLKDWFSRHSYPQTHHTCTVCKLTHGICVPCSCPGCSSYVHPYCSLARGLLVAGDYAKEEYTSMWQKYFEECTLNNAGRTLRKDTKGFRSSAPRVKSQDLAKALLQSSLECSPEAIDALRSKGSEIVAKLPSAELDKAPKWLYAPHKNVNTAVYKLVDDSLQGNNPCLLVFCARCREPSPESIEPVQKLRMSAALQEQRERSLQNNLRNKCQSMTVKYDWKGKLRERFQQPREGNSQPHSSRNAEKELELPGYNALKQFLGYPGFRDEDKTNEPRNNRSQSTCTTYEPVDALIEAFPGIPLHLFPRELCERAYLRIKSISRQPSLISSIIKPEQDSQEEQRRKKEMQVQLQPSPEGGERLLRQLAVGSQLVVYWPMKPMKSDPHLFRWGGGNPSRNINCPKNTDSYWRSRSFGLDLLPFCPAKLTSEAFIAGAKRADLASGNTVQHNYRSVDDILVDWSSRVPIENINNPLANAVSRQNKNSTLAHQSSKPKAGKNDANDLVVIHTNEKGEQVVRNTSEEDRIPLCVCRKPYLTDASPMIACSSCDEWFHFHCLGLEAATESQIKAAGKNPDGEWYYHTATDVLVDVRDDIWCPWCEPRLAPWRGLFSVWGYRGDDVFFPDINGITDRASLYDTANKYREAEGLPPLLGDASTEGLKGVDETAYGAHQLIRINGHVLVRKYNPFTGGFIVNKEDKLRRTRFNVGGAGGIFGSPYNTPPWKLWENMKQQVDKEHLRKARDFWMKIRAQHDRDIKESLEQSDNKRGESSKSIEVTETGESRGKRKAASQASQWLSETMKTGKKIKTTSTGSNQDVHVTNTSQSANATQPKHPTPHSESILAAETVTHSVNNDKETLRKAENVQSQNGEAQNSSDTSSDSGTRKRTQREESPNPAGKTCGNSEGPLRRNAKRQAQLNMNS